jgi:hypothetical protein
MIDGEGGVLKKMRFEEAEEAVFLELGASPQTPGIYRIGANPEGEGRRPGVPTAHLRSWPLGRRSGWFPPLPYLPPRPSEI